MASSACDHPVAGRPLIGLTSYWSRPVRDLGPAGGPVAAVYINAVAQAGGRPVLLPPTGNWDVAEVSTRRRDPDRRGRCRPWPLRAAGAADDGGAADPGRPRARAVAAAEAAGVPCRHLSGSQVLNVARGGHCPARPRRARARRHQISAATFSDTSVSIVPRSRLAAVLGAARPCGAITTRPSTARPRPAIAATAPTAPSRRSRPPTGRAVHARRAVAPEENPADLRLFAALIDIARERRSARRSAAEPKGRRVHLPTM